MNQPYLTKKRVAQFIQTALSEDIGNGDHSSLGAIPKDAERKAILLIKDDGIIAGIKLVQLIFHNTAPDLELKMSKKDGDKVENGEVAFEVAGKAHDILRLERLVLNCLQRMSGIATYTHKINSLIRGTNAKLLDTRKTTPNFRLAEKWAVAIGGGVNHRFGLFDMVMLKDNHVDYAGSVEAAISNTQKYLSDNNLSLDIEIEVRNLDELAAVLKVGGVKRIMLDNMLPSDMRQAVAMIGGRYESEASGGITEKNIREIAETGVDFISVGALTHSYKSLDMSLKAF
ncbi:MAG: carboxylating nicotinate-nucleotide diphosphorylase [Cytophagales bacterium]|nr:carboxylating nicotinate-nucleotide diphosphorylase [Cytophagales bacterium]